MVMVILLLVQEIGTGKTIMINQRDLKMELPMSRGKITERKSFRN